MAKSVHRYRIDATVAGEIEYDPANPASYTNALVQVDETRKGLEALGATITKQTGKPVAVKG